MAAALARMIGGEVVNADAFQLYRGMPITTAQPTASEVAQAPHHLFETLDPAEECTAARYAAMAQPVLAEVAARGRTAIVVGGSGLYVKALTHGLAEVPEPGAALRGVIRALPPEAATAWLLRLDPDAGSCTDLQNPRRVGRALEISLALGMPISQCRTGFPDDPPALCGALLQLDRAALYTRINRRTDAMLTAGWIAEVASLPDLSATAEGAIGIRPLREVASGAKGIAEAAAEIQQATRRYAKRQMTWFRRERWLTPVPVADGEAPEETAARIADAFLPSAG